MNLPNLLTMSRFFFAVVILYLLLANNLAAIMTATFLFLIAAITDFYDGYLAKKHGLISDFGKIMDPIADKVLMIFVFFALAALGMMDWWMVILIVIREVAVTVARLKAMAHGQVLAAEKAGKIKTVFQMVSIGAALLFLICEQSVFARSWFYQAEPMWRAFIQIMMLISVLLTVYSGVIFFRHKWAPKKTSSTT